MENHIVIKEYKENTTIVKVGSSIIIHENQVEYFVKEGIIEGHKTKTNKKAVEKKEVIKKNEEVKK